MSTKPFMIMAGGTGGHVFPGLAVAQALQAQGQRILWLGSRAGMEAKLVPERGIAFEALDVAGFRGKGLLKLLQAPFMLLRSICQGIKLIRQHQPACVLSFGGFAAGPGGIAAWLLGRPLLVHEQNQSLA
jgi:UDP-N-acetylglucosamine--N-acetylmuramyl-(pentapeptide) pyrophosphoryl-undecaprenol N-acetylglucosamine transferase